MKTFRNLALGDSLSGQFCLLPPSFSPVAAMMTTMDLSTAYGTTSRRHYRAISNSISR